MIEERQFLNFIPPKLDGDFVEDKRRYMIVSRNDNNIIDMINISKISGKNSKILIKDYNVILDNFYPLKLPSFAKTNTLYRIKYFSELENYISFGGQKLNEKDFKNILLERNKYINKVKQIKIIEFKKEDFLNKNSTLINI